LFFAEIGEDTLTKREVGWMAKQVIQVITILVVVLFLASGCDWFDNPSTVGARNRIRRAQAQRMEIQNAIAEREAEQRLLFAAQRHEMATNMKWVVLYVALAVGTCAVLTYGGVGAHRIYTESKRRHCLARAQALKAEAALIREGRLKAEVSARLREIAADGRALPTEVDGITHRERGLLKKVA
jgi:hypothetical protein